MNTVDYLYWGNDRHTTWIPSIIFTGIKTNIRKEIPIKTNIRKEIPSITFTRVKTNIRKEIPSITFTGVTTNILKEIPSITFTEVMTNILKGNTVNYLYWGND